MANPSVPRALRFEHRPEWMVAAVMYPHIFEGWSLFSPEAPLSDETVVVDAVTRDGRHVDPYNEVGSRVSSLPVERRARAPGPRFVLVRLHAAHSRRAHVPPGAARMDPALPRADRARRRTRSSASRRSSSGRTARSRARRSRPTSARGASCATPRAPEPVKLAKFRRYFVDQYMTVDARSLGFGRIVLALILLLDLVRRVPDPHAVLFERRADPEPHDAVAAAHAVDVLVLLHPVAPRRGRGRLRAVRPHLPGAARRLADAADAGPGADLRAQPAQPRHAARERRRLDAGRAGAVDGVPAARAALLRRRRARQPARAARDDGGRAGAIARRWT